MRLDLQKMKWVDPAVRELGKVEAQKTGMGLRNSTEQATFKPSQTTHYHFCFLELMGYPKIGGNASRIWLRLQAPASIQISFLERKHICTCFVSVSGSEYGAQYWAHWSRLKKMLVDIIICRLLKSLVKSFEAFPWQSSDVCFVWQILQYSESHIP